jgi:hypothetical protein
MEQADVNVPEWKQPELKVSDPELVVEPDGSSGALTTSGDCADAFGQIVVETRAAAIPLNQEITQMSGVSAFSAYMLENESQFYWLCASALLTVLGIWFHNIHGILIWSSPLFSLLCFAISLFAPLFCISILFCQPNKIERPLLTIVSFIGLLFWNQVVTISCLMLMPFRFKNASRSLGIAALSGLQIGVFFLYPLLGGPITVQDELHTAGYNLRLCQVKTLLDRRSTLTLEEDIPVGPFLTFGKVHRRMIDTRAPQSAVILPVDATHVAVLINRFSHYHRTVVDLTVKNLPIYVENIPAER